MLSSNSDFTVSYIACTSSSFFENPALLYRRKLNWKANVEGSSTCYSVQRVVPGAFNMGFKRSTCTAQPCTVPLW